MTIRRWIGRHGLRTGRIVIGAIGVVGFLATVPARLGVATIASGTDVVASLVAS